MTRVRVSLNGDWDFHPLKEISPPEGPPETNAWQSRKLRIPSSWRWSIDLCAEYQPYNLFEYPPAWNDVQAGWIQRSFAAEIPTGKRAWLHFEAVLQRSVYFINGKRVYASTESTLPIEFDVTDHLQPGLNELAVWCGPFERLQTAQGEKILAPGGSWFAALARGPWQDVWLEIVPAVSLSDIAVRTSVRMNQIEAEITLENRTLAAFSGLLRLRVCTGEEEVFAFPAKQVDLALGVMSTLRLTEEWSDARLWSPEDPYLYRLEAVLEQAGQIIDVRGLRFGFREVWLDGHKFILNGVRVNLRGDAWHYQGLAMQTKRYAENWYHMCKEAGVNFVRLHAMPYPEFFLDAADEMGMLIVDESAIYGSGKAMQADHPTFLRNCHDHLRALVRRDRSHPSVIIWSMQNEMRWVDGREGYRAEMPALTRTIKELDPTRPVSYDGDNRLFPPEQSEIVSMHYNIDGTVSGWGRERPLIFGEHGAFHYVSPQVAARYGGPAAYLSFDEAMRALAWSERLFIEYARHEEVTGLTPFNLVNYTLRSLPAQNARLDPEPISVPGIHPQLLPAGCLTVNNGLAPDPLVYVPTPAWRELAAGFQPVAVFADELNTHFFSGSTLRRSFSLYNDTLQTQKATLSWRWLLADQNSGRSLDAGTAEFLHSPGARLHRQLEVKIPAVADKTNLALLVELRHTGGTEFTTQFNYWIYPPEVQPLATAARVHFLGSEEDFILVNAHLPQARRADTLTAESLESADVLVVGPDCRLRFEDYATDLDGFVRSGGALLILEQDRFIPGELTLTDRSFPLVFINDAAHPIFAGLNDTDLRFWDKANPWGADARGLTRGAFVKPAGGDLRVLLEAGDGDFGWGGLLWTPLVEYTLGRGRVLCSQIALRDYAPYVPPARVLLRNLLAYACNSIRPVSSAGEHRSAALMLATDAPVRTFFKAVGVNGQEMARPGGVVVLDPDELDAGRGGVLRGFLATGGQILVLPARPEHAAALSDLAGTAVRIEEAPVYQLAPCAHDLTRGIAVHDLYHFEKVTYTPANLNNRLVARHSLEVEGGQRLLESVHNPWKDFFVDGKDGEYQKVAIATQVVRTPFQAQGYAAAAPVGAGRLVFCQMLPENGNAKIIRIYARLLGNLGAALESGLLHTMRQARDFAVDTWMALPRQKHQDGEVMEVYFSDPGYTLNNLGEGVFGWMKRATRENGAVTIPGSAGQIWFLSVFVESEINRDPERRAAGELPDSSIVPDLYLEVNRPCRVYVNGRRIFYCVEAPEGIIKVEDVVLVKGTNRLVLVCDASSEDLRLNTWFLNKYGDPPEGLHYRPTLD